MLWYLYGQLLLWRKLLNLAGTFNVWLTAFFWQPKQLGSLLDEDPAIMQRRTALAKRLELYKSAQAEIDAVAWSK